MPRQAAKPTPRTHWIESPKALAALASPLRQEVIDAAAAHAAPLSIAELARHLGRPADRLYFHVRALERAGLLISDGARKEGRHVAALYRLPAAMLRLRYRPATTSRTRAITAVVDGVLRLARRDFRRAMSNVRASVEGPLRDTWGGRMKGFLTTSEQRRLNELITEIDTLVRAARPRKNTRPVAFTFVRVPLDRGPGFPARAPRRPLRKTTHDSAVTTSKRRTAS